MNFLEEVQFSIWRNWTLGIDTNLISIFKPSISSHCDHSVTFGFSSQWAVYIEFSFPLMACVVVKFMCFIASVSSKSSQQKHEFGNGNLCCGYKQQKDKQIFCSWSLTIVPFSFASSLINCARGSVYKANGVGLSGHPCWQPLSGFLFWLRCLLILILVFGKFYKVLMHLIN